MGGTMISRCIGCMDSITLLSEIHPHRRAAFIVRLMPAASHYDHGLGESMRQKNASHDYGRCALYSVHGKDVSGKNNFKIGH